MIKIAVTTDNGKISEHFGHCESFTVFDTDNKQIMRSEIIPNPGHKPGFLPNFLNGLGVNVIISGGMGSGANNIFAEKGIEVITGATGEAEAAVQAYLQGNLKSTGSICCGHEHGHEHEHEHGHEHQHHGECGHC